MVYYDFDVDEIVASMCIKYIYVTIYRWRSLYWMLRQVNVKLNDVFQILILLSIC